MPFFGERCCVAGLLVDVCASALLGVACSKPDYMHFSTRFSGGDIPVCWSNATTTSSLPLSGRLHWRCGAGTCPVQVFATARGCAVLVSQCSGFSSRPVRAWRLYLAFGGTLCPRNVSMLWLSLQCLREFSEEPIVLST